ncbi:heparinase [Pseudidiomarina aestuarii]|uniref:Heparinase n=1 Tax=Pseudidiomarina aestuarii TaxID=624146 RepID=A0A2T4CU32_9GAMM|nr:heparinase [Pseudidiomarina aestuarii]PTB85092.1 heparinase [Pseudidiomarina aestuarii]PTB89156.1 heparinase [Pseudidiomarina aestuarii]
MLMMRKLWLLIATVRHLRLIQIVYQVWYRLRPRPKLAHPIIPKVASWQRGWQAPFFVKQSYFAPSKFQFLNKECEISDVADWNSKNAEKLWLYNLHYFDDLNAVGSPERVKEHCALMLRWIAENPEMQGNGWEPYPLSLRIVNWIKWCSRNSGVIDNSQLAAIHSSLYQQVRALSRQIEYHIQANHLFANIKALVFAGGYFDTDEAKKWLKQALKQLQQELDKQFLADGGHYERSPMYHCILMTDLMDLLHLHQCSEVLDLKLNENIRTKLSKAFKWLSAMRHPDGEICFFNDSTFGIALSVDELLSYAKFLGARVENSSQSALLKESGFTVLEGTLGTSNAKLIADVGSIAPSYQPGHAHAEALSFELSIGAQRVFVNSGISEYGMTEERHRQRSTRAHNTVVVADSDSAGIWAGFRVARRSRTRVIDCSDTQVVAVHDGYRHLNEKPRHTRRLSLEQDALVIHDEVSSEHVCKAYFYLHPAVEITPNDIKMTIKVSNDTFCVSFEGFTHLSVVDSTWHPGFGLSVPNKCIEVTFKRRLLMKLYS